jgi:hypothetical protein
MHETIRYAWHSSALLFAFIALLCLGGFARADDISTWDASSACRRNFCWLPLDHDAAALAQERGTLIPIIRDALS